MGFVLWCTDDGFREQNPGNQQKTRLDDCLTARRPRQMGSMKPRGRGMVACSSNGHLRIETSPSPASFSVNGVFQEAHRAAAGVRVPYYGSKGRPVVAHERARGYGQTRCHFLSMFFEGLRKSGIHQGPSHLAAEIQNWGSVCQAPTYPSGWHHLNMPR